MRAPAFWQAEPLSGAAQLLRPAGRLVGFMAARRLAREGGRAAVPVVCIGNFTVGGAGKTPTSLAVAALLREAGESPAFLSRGYGGRLSGPLVVDPARHDPSEVGDEPLLLARAGLCIIACDRPAGAALAATEGASAIVMDDGLQNPSLRKDLTIAVVDGATGLGNGLVLPAGPLRAPMAVQWPLVAALLVVGAGEPGERVLTEAEVRGKAVLRARLVPDPAAAARLRGRRVLAFAGIGRPEKFFATLREAGALVVESRPFPDHHAYRPAEIAGLAARALAQGLTLATTEKDHVRLGRPGAIEVLPVRLEADDPAALAQLVGGALAAFRARTGG